MAKRKASKRPRKTNARAPRKAAPARRAVEAALAGIAHDIRTPLTGIMALAELLAASDIGAREREWAKAIKSGADHLAVLSSLIVDAARADAARLVLRHEPFSPRALAETVGQALVARAGNRNVTAKIEIASDLPALVSGDALRLRAALENLGDNAVRNSPMTAASPSAPLRTGARRRVPFDFHGDRQRHRHERRGNENCCSGPSRRRARRSRGATAAPASGWSSSSASPRRWAATSR